MAIYTRRNAKIPLICIGIAQGEAKTRGGLGAVKILVTLEGPVVSAAQAAYYLVRGNLGQHRSLCQIDVGLLYEHTSHTSP